MRYSARYETKHPHNHPNNHCGLCHRTIGESYFGRNKTLDSARKPCYYPFPSMGTSAPITHRNARPRRSRLGVKYRIRKKKEIFRISIALRFDEPCTRLQFIPLGDTAYGQLFRDCFATHGEAEKELSRLIDFIAQYTR